MRSAEVTVAIPFSRQTVAARRSVVAGHPIPGVPLLRVPSCSVPSPLRARHVLLEVRPRKAPPKDNAVPAGPAWQPSIVFSCPRPVGPASRLEADRLDRTKTLVLAVSYISFSEALL